MQACVTHVLSIWVAHVKQNLALANSVIVPTVNVSAETVTIDNLKTNLSVSAHAYAKRMSSIVLSFDGSVT